MSMIIKNLKAAAAALALALFGATMGAQAQTVLTAPNESQLRNLVNSNPTTPLTVIVAFDGQLTQTITIQRTASLTIQSDGTRRALTSPSTMWARHFTWDVGNGLNANLTFNDITLDGNNVSGGIVASSSGDTSVSGLLTLNNVIIENCKHLTLGFGGSGAYWRGNVSVTGNSQIKNNESHNLTGADIHGGGIYATGTFTMDSGVVSGNKIVVSSTAFAHGGGVYAGGAVTLSGSAVVSGNEASNEGGGVYSSGITIIGGTVTISGNTAGTAGGGVHGYPTTATIIGGSATISGNTAGTTGGGVHGTAVTLNDSAVVSGNRATDDGGGVWSDTLVSLDNTAAVNGNTAGGNGGGVAAWGMVYLSGSAVVTNNTASNNGGGVLGRSVTLNNTAAVSGNTAGAYGGGIYASDTVTINGIDAVVSGNAATEALGSTPPSPPSGGGIWAGNTFIMYGGRISGNYADGNGGGVYVNGTSQTSVQLLNGAGGTIGGTTTLGTETPSLLAADGNYAGSMGGGIYTRGGVEFGPYNMTEVCNNSAGQGGGIYSVGGEGPHKTMSVVIQGEDAKITNNRARTGDGGGIHAYRVTMSDGMVSGNEANGNGGGIFVDFTPRACTYFTISGGVISGNVAGGDGGGVYFAGGTEETGVPSEININGGRIGGTGTLGTSSPDRSGGTAVGNYAAGNGGGLCAIAFNNGDPRYDGCRTTFAAGANTADIRYNSAQNGGGIYLGRLVWPLDLTTIQGNGVIIGYNVARTGNGGGVYATTLANLRVGADPVFTGNSALIGYHRDPSDDADYNNYILGTSWSSPFTQGYNNYDIAYTSSSAFAPTPVYRVINDPSSTTFTAHLKMSDGTWKDVMGGVNVASVQDALDAVRVDADARSFAAITLWLGDSTGGGNVAPEAGQAHTLNAEIPPSPPFYMNASSHHLDFDGASWGSIAVTLEGNLAGYQNMTMGEFILIQNDAKIESKANITGTNFWNIIRNDNVSEQVSLTGGTILGENTSYIMSDPGPLPTFAMVVTTDNGPLIINGATIRTTGPRTYPLSVSSGYAQIIDGLLEANGSAYAVRLDGLNPGLYIYNGVIVNTDGGAVGTGVYGQANYISINGGTLKGTTHVVAAYNSQIDISGGLIEQTGSGYGNAVAMSGTGQLRISGNPELRRNSDPDNNAIDLRFMSGTMTLTGSPVLFGKIYLDRPGQLSSVFPADFIPGGKVYQIQILNGAEHEAVAVADGAVPVNFIGSFAYATDEWDLKTLGNNIVLDQRYFSLYVVNGLGSGSYTNLHPVEITADPPETGYVFDYWSISSGGGFLANVNNATTIYVMPANAAMLTANYKAQTYGDEPGGPMDGSGVELDGNGGNPATQWVVATFDQPLPVNGFLTDGTVLNPLVTPTRTGYTFEGFFENNDGTGRRYYDEDMTPDQTWDKPQGGVTIYAIWGIPSMYMIEDTSADTPGGFFTLDPNDPSVRPPSGKYTGRNGRPSYETGPGAVIDYDDGNGNGKDGYPFVVPEVPGFPWSGDEGTGEGEGYDYVFDEDYPAVFVIDESDPSKTNAVIHVPSGIIDIYEDGKKGDDDTPDWKLIPDGTTPKVDDMDTDWFVFDPKDPNVIDFDSKYQDTLIDGKDYGENLVDLKPGAIIGHTDHPDAGGFGWPKLDGDNGCDCDNCPWPFEVPEIPEYPWNGGADNGGHDYVFVPDENIVIIINGNGDVVAEIEVTDASGSITIEDGAVETGQTGKKVGRYTPPDGWVGDIEEDFDVWVWIGGEKYPAHLDEEGNVILDKALPDDMCGEDLNIVIVVRNRNTMRLTYKEDTITAAGDDWQWLTVGEIIAPPVSVNKDVLLAWDTAQIAWYTPQFRARGTVKYIVYTSDTLQAPVDEWAGQYDTTVHDTKVLQVGADMTRGGSLWDQVRMLDSAQEATRFYKVKAVKVK